VRQNSLPQAPGQGVVAAHVLGDGLELGDRDAEGARGVDAVARLPGPVGRASEPFEPDHQGIVVHGPIVADVARRGLPSHNGRRLEMNRRNDHV